MGDVDELTPEELQAAREDGADPTVVDIRPPAAFRRGHIPGSVNVPFPELGSVDLAEADHVVTVCPHGHDSVRAARILGSRGDGAGDTRIESLAGGLTAWDGPVERGRADDSTGDKRDATDGDSDGPTAPF